MACPARECGRPVWGVCDEAGFRLCTHDVPDLGAGRYVRDRGRILDHGQELVALAGGLQDSLDGLVTALNAAGLEDWEVGTYVRAFIQHATGTYTPGPALIRSLELARLREEASSRENPPCPNRPDSSATSVESASGSSSRTGSPRGRSVRSAAAD